MAIVVNCFGVVVWCTFSLSTMHMVWQFSVFSFQFLLDILVELLSLLRFPPNQKILFVDLIVSVPT